MLVSIPYENLSQMLDAKSIVVMNERDKMRQNWLDSQKGFWGFLIGEPKKDLAWKESFYEHKLSILGTMRHAASLRGSIQMELETLRWLKDLSCA